MGLLRRYRSCRDEHLTAGDPAVLGIDRCLVKSEGDHSGQSRGFGRMLLALHFWSAHAM